MQAEGEGLELDVSAMRCTVVRSRAVRRVQDADKEEWDVFPPGEEPLGAAAGNAALGLQPGEKREKRKYTTRKDREAAAGAARPALSIEAADTSPPKKTKPTDIRSYFGRTSATSASAVAAAAAQQASGLEFSPSDPPAKTGSTQIQLSALALEQANGVVACAYKCVANNDQLPPMASAYATLNA